MRAYLLRLPVVWGLLAGVLTCGGGAVGQRSWAADGRPVACKVLFLGNSITRHPPKPSIGWTNDWGMAASAQERDYVHLVAAGLAQRAGVAPQILVRSLVDLERQPAKFDFAQRLKESLAFQADLVIVALGENVPKLDTDAAKAQFRDAMTKLLQILHARPQTMLLVRSCFWANPAKDQILKETCQAAGGIFVDIGRLGKDPANFARSERAFQHAGVAMHPGDKGMQAIARAILQAIRETATAKGK